MEKEAADRSEGDTRSTEKAVEVVRKDGNIYLPAVGYASVLLFSTHVTNPRLLRRYDIAGDNTRNRFAVRDTVSCFVSN
jgi:hypothetical protein